jgi:hypothetical protein
MHLMKRFSLASVVALVVFAVVPSAVSASELQIGKTPTPLSAPVCPAGVAQDQCNIVAPQLTVFNTNTDGIGSPMTVTKTGELVSVTIGLSAISSNPSTVRADVSYLDSTYGGPAEAQLTVLRRVGKASKLRWSVAATSPAYLLAPYFGQVVEFPLATPLPVVPGELVALTVPTWAPVLSYGLAANKFSYRQSRTVNCTKPPAPAGSRAVGGGVTVSEAQLTIGQVQRYGCRYAGTRVQYSAEEVTTPIPSSVLK